MLPLSFKLAALVEKQEREDRAELWRHYMGSIAHGLGGKSFAEILESYEYSRKSEDEKQKDVEAAHAMADDVLQRLERARGGVNHGRGV